MKVLLLLLVGMIFLSGCPKRADLLVQESPYKQVNVKGTIDDIEGKLYQLHRECGVLLVNYLRRQPNAKNAYFNLHENQNRSLGLNTGVGSWILVDLVEIDSETGPMVNITARNTGYPWGDMTDRLVQALTDYKGSETYKGTCGYSFSSHGPEFW